MALTECMLTASLLRIPHRCVPGIERSDRPAFCAYMLVGIPSTGSGGASCHSIALTSTGLINTIHAFATGSIVTGVFGIVASVGWGLELLGILWEYRSVRPCPGAA